MFSSVVITALTLATLQNIFPEENDYVIIAEDMANLIHASRKFGRLHMLHARVEFDGVTYTQSLSSPISLEDAENPQNISSYCGFLSLNPEDTNIFEVSGTDTDDTKLIHPFMLTYNALVLRGLVPPVIDGDWPDGIQMVTTGEPIQLRTKKESHTDLYTKYESIANAAPADLDRDEVATVERLCYRSLDDTTVDADQKYTSTDLILRTTLIVPDASTSTALLTYLRRYFEEAIHCQRLTVSEEVNTDQHQIFLDIPANETSTQIAC